MASAIGPIKIINIDFAPHIHVTVNAIGHRNTGNLLFLKDIKILGNLSLNRIINYQQNFFEVQKSYFSLGLHSFFIESIPFRKQKVGV